jgi:tellurite resistance protein TerC
MKNELIYEWAGFVLLIVGALAADLRLFHRKAHKVSVKEALLESARWIGLSLAFGLYIYLSRGREAGIEFLTGYLLEKSLSVDNIFVFVLIFSSMRIPERSQHKLLFYGIGGALVMRGIFVMAGVALMEKIQSVSFVFAAILLIAGLRMLRPGVQSVQPERNPIVRLARRVIPFADHYEGDRLTVLEDGRRKATRLLLVLVAIEAMDILFAVDSVPAVLAITQDSFIAFSSNVLAILGLRSLYFALAGILPKVRYLHQGLAAVLIFVAGKMFAAHWIRVSATVSLAMIGAILVVTALASALAPRRQTDPTSK